MWSRQRFSAGQGRAGLRCLLGDPGLPSAPDTQKPVPNLRISPCRPCPALLLARGVEASLLPLLDLRTGFEKAGKRRGAYVTRRSPVQWGT